MWNRESGHFWPFCTLLHTFSYFVTKLPRKLRKKFQLYFFSYFNIS